MKKDDKNSYEPEAKRHYKKKYIERKVEEKEADDQIKEYDPDLEEFYGNYGGTD